MEVWDAIVVGAGPAGCAAAYDLAAAGRRVLLVDKASFPRPKACAGGLTAKAVRALRYSIAPVVRRTVSEIVLEQPTERPDSPDPRRRPDLPEPREAVNEELRVGRRSPVCVMTVRSELDAYSLEQTRARGAIFRRVGALLALRHDSDRVALTFEGEPEPLVALFVLGADGVHSRVRALSAKDRPASATALAPWFRKAFALEANVPYRATGTEFPLVFDFAPVAGGYGWLFPRDNHVNVGLYLADAEAGPGCALLDRSALTEYIAKRCGTREHEPAVGQFLGLGAAGYIPADTRVLLAGDAAGFVDPLTGEGIYGAIVSGQAAARAMLRALAQGGDAGSRYHAALSPQRADLLVAEAAARRFYAEPRHGFRLMRLAPVRRAVLHAYAEGTRLTLLARGIGALRTIRALAQRAPGETQPTPR